jgi:SAM-dependent methyltransferase
MSNTNNYDVDVDNPKWQPNLNSIATHSKIADYYKYRPPYLAEFFHIGAIKMKLRKSDKLLDLCCGRGELANGFSNYVDKIKAVDGSSQMLKNSIARNNISYHLADVNHDEMNFIEEIDHIVIGSAIHWVSQKTWKISPPNILIHQVIYLYHTHYSNTTINYMRINCIN